MNFRTVLKHLEKLGEVNFEEFAKATGIPRHNASVYLSRLFKMGLSSRRRDRRYGREYHRKPYLYQISEKGIQYLKYEKTTKATIKRHYDEEFKRENKHLDLLRIREETRDIEKKLAEPAPEPEKKIPYVTRDAVMLHLTPSELLNWKKFEEEQKIAEKEREKHEEDRRWQKEESRQREDEQKNREDKDLVEWVIGKGDNTLVVKVRPETIPMLIEAQSKRSGESEEIRILLDEIKQLHEDAKQRDAQFQAFQTGVLQKEINELKAKVAVDPIDQLFEQKDKLEKLGIIPSSEEKQMQREYGLKGNKIFDRENRKGPIREILLPRYTNLRPRNILGAKFTYEQVMKEGKTPGYEPPHLGALFPRPLRSIWGRPFW